MGSKTRRGTQIVVIRRWDDKGDWSSADRLRHGSLRWMGDERWSMRQRGMKQRCEWAVRAGVRGPDFGFTARSEPSFS
jgi:hypothetical protein